MSDEKPHERTTAVLKDPERIVSTILSGQVSAIEPALAFLLARFPDVRARLEQFHAQALREFERETDLEKKLSLAAQVRTYHKIVPTLERSRIVDDFLRALTP